MLRTLRRMTVQLILLAIVLFAAYLGVMGAEVVAIELLGEEFFKGPFTPLSPQIWLAILLMVFGCSVSCYGAMFLFYLPIATWFPDDCRTFRLMHKPSKKMAKILRWYSRALDKQAKEVERDA